MLIRTVWAFCAWRRSVTDKKNKQKTDKLGLLAPQGVDPPPQIFRICRGGCTLHISSKHCLGPTPVYGARAENPLQNADFAMKQTNICRLSGDIISHEPGGRLPLLYARPAVTFSDREHHRPLAGTKLYCLVTKVHGCELWTTCPELLPGSGLYDTKKG